MKRERYIEVMIRAIRYFTDDEMGEVLSKYVRATQDHSKNVNQQKPIPQGMIGIVLYDINGDPDDPTDKDYRVVIEWEDHRMDEYRKDEFDLYCELVLDEHGQPITVIYEGQQE